MEKIKSIAIDTLMEVAMELAAGKCKGSMDSVEQMILLLEVTADNEIVAGRPAEELERLKDRFVALQNELFKYADRQEQY